MNFNGETDEFLYDPRQEARKKNKRETILMIVGISFLTVFFGLAALNLYYTIRLTNDIERVSNDLTTNIDRINDYINDMNKTEIEITIEKIEKLIDYACNAINCQSLSKEKNE